MKGILNNPKFVVLLAAGALFIAGSNIFMPLFSNGFGDTEQDVPPVGLEPFDVQPQNIQVARTLAGPARDGNLSAGAIFEDSFGHLPRDSDLSEIGWARAPSRDPFRFIEPNVAVASEVEQVHDNLELQAASLAENEPEGLNVNALVIGPNYKLAVVDGQLVKEGAIVLAGRINALSTAGVEYRDSDGARQVVPMQQLNLEPSRQ